MEGQRWEDCSSSSGKRRAYSEWRKPSREKTSGKQFPLAFPPGYQQHWLADRWLLFSIRFSAPVMRASESTMIKAPARDTLKKSWEKNYRIGKQSKKICSRPQPLMSLSRNIVSSCIPSCPLGHTLLSSSLHVLLAPQSPAILLVYTSMFTLSLLKAAIRVSCGRG